MFKTFAENNTVVHDLRLRGAADVAHQIDVTIERNGVPVRILVECKDFDLASRKKVGLPVLVHLFGVMTDIGATEGYVVSCNQFSREALKFAKNTGIKCVTMREFRESDWENRIHTIEINLYAVVPKGFPVLEFGAPDQESVDLLLPYLQSGQVNDAAFGAKLVLPLHKFVESQMNALKNSMVGPIETRVNVGEAALEFGTDRIPINEIKLKYEFISLLARTITVTGNGTALLLIRGLDDADLVVWDKDLEAYTINENGTVVKKA